jgi:1-deoxy-D-xylulose 5-phosphate reductoisomerase
VRSFLDHRLSFPGIPEVVEDVLTRMTPRPVTSIEDVEAADFEARTLARESVIRLN